MFQTIRNSELELIRSPDADIYLQGAHLTRFRDWLFLSSRSHFAAGKAIRGGVPVVFPWFGPKRGDAAAPQHGVARTALWQIENVSDDAITLQLPSDLWLARLTFGFGRDELRLRFEVENRGEQALEFECALHSYFAVDDARNVVIEGLDGKTYLDKTDDYRRVVQRGAVSLRGETDRTYLDAGGPIAIRDGARTIHLVGAEGWRSTVVWNPWSAVAAQMKDLGDDEWTRYVCVECGAIAADSITLEPGATYALDFAVRVEPKDA